jgi:hypothetical protein
MLGVLATAFFVMLWIMLGKRMVLLLAALIAIAATVALVLIERRIVTDREYLTGAIYDMADSVRNNYSAGVTRYVHPDRRDIAHSIDANMNLYRVRQCTILGFNEVSISPSASPSASPTAVADFVVWAEASEVQDGVEYAGNVRIRLYFEKRGEHWFLTNYGYQPGASQAQIQMNF